MRWNSFLTRFQALLWPRNVERELDEELRSHIELQATKYVGQGATVEQARRRARVDFGGVERVREECREIDQWQCIDRSARNLKHCFRSLKKAPGFALVFILILTIAIGSNLAVFSTIDAFFLRPLPVDRPEELARISAVDKQRKLEQLPSTVLDTIKDNRAFQGLCGFATWLVPTEIDGNMRSMGVAEFTGSCFGTLGIHLQLGRPITAADDRAGAPGIAVISDALWHSAFGGRAGVLGHAIKIEDKLFTIVGVTDKRFTGLLFGFPEPVMIPLRQDPAELPGGRKQTYWWVNIIARRAPGVSQQQALASITTERRQLLEQSVPYRYNAAERKDYVSQDLAVTPAKTGVDYFLRDRFGQPLYAIFGICAAMLLIACVNLTSLLLARSLNRRREVAVRLALGAKPSHIAGIFVLENAMLVLAGAACGIIVAFWTARTMLAQGGRMFGNFSVNVGLDLRVIVFLLGAVLLTLGIFAGASLWQARRLCRAEALKESGRSVTAPHTTAQKTLVGVQIALTLAFVAGGALLGASVKQMYSIDLGIKPQNVWEVLLAARPGGYRNFAPEPYYRDLLQQIETLPDVLSASLSDAIPFFTSTDPEPVANIENAEPGRELQARVLGTGGNFFKTLGAKIIVGRDFQREDDNSGEPAVILSWSLAEHLGDPRQLIGHHVRVGNESEYQRLKIIGIASDMDLNLANLDDQKPLAVYIDLWQHRSLQRYPVLLIKTGSNTLTPAAIRRIVDGKRREYIERFTTIDSEIDNALIENKLLAYVSGAFAVLALVMAAVGLFGLLSYQVTNRTSEIGIRMALGAKRIQIQWLILRQIMRLLVIGTLAGIALTFFIERVIAGLLFGISGYSVSPLCLSVSILAATALTAAWIPIQRASAIDPLEALRHD